MKIKYGVKISTIVTIKSKINNRELKTSSANLFLFLSSILAEVQLGINAALNVPSANNLLKVFGNLNATKKHQRKLTLKKNCY